MFSRTLQDILYKTGSQEIIHNNLLWKPAGITSDSRLVSNDYLFVATRGTQVDGHIFIDKAIASGAKAVICETLPEQLTEGISYIVVPNSQEALGIAAANFYGNPSSKMKVVAVTGTNGKTTVATLLFRLFRGLGYSCGLLSTVQNQINETVIPATHTTPDAVQLQALLAKMLAEGVNMVFMEASSHAIHQRRIAGLEIDGAIFTNITHDHLDYHGTFDEYIKAKKLLFDLLPSSAFAISNLDDKRGKVMLQNCKGKRLYYSLTQSAEYKAKVLGNGLQGLNLEIDGQEVWFQLIGLFNAYNLLAVYGAAIELGERPEEVLLALSGLTPAAGRFQRVLSNTGITVIVDYAHTPDALENVLSSIKEFRTTNERVITVVGCGGNRDKAKRPEMARIALKYSDLLLLTSDNPRNEEPQAIIDDMQAGVGPSMFRKSKQILDRREAIFFAISEAVAGDIVLIAGKGHEEYQEVKGVKHPFSDVSVASEALLLKERG